MKVVLVRSRAIDPSVTKLASALCRNGYAVEVLLWDRAGTNPAAPEDSYSISRFKAPAPYDTPLAALLLPLWWIYEMLFLLRSQPDVVHACDMDTLLPAIVSKLLLRCRLCYTIFDFYASNLPSAVPARVRRFVGDLEKASLASVDILFLPDECRYDQVRGARIGRLVYLYNSPQDLPKLEQSKPSEASGRLNLFYAGLLHKSRGLRFVIDVVLQLPHVKLVVAGKGPEERWLREKAARNPDRIEYIGQIPYGEVLEETRRADVLFALYDPAVPNSAYASPNKVFEAMMCAKPIVVNQEGAASKIVLDENCGIAVPYGDGQALRNSIALLAGDPMLRYKLGKNGRKAYESKFGWDIMERRLLDSYRLLECQGRVLHD